jgi:hypothetical protein
MKKDDKTEIIDMLSELQKEVPDRLARVSAKPVPDKDQGALFDRLSKQKQDPIKEYSADKTLHQSLNSADKKAVDWANKVRDVNMQLNERAALRNSIREKQKLLENIVKSGKSGIKAAGIGGLAVGLGSLLSSGDASAAIPVLSEAEALGPQKGMEDYEIENPQASPELRKAALQRLLGK